MRGDLSPAVGRASERAFWTSELRSVVLPEVMRTATGELCSMSCGVVPCGGTLPLRSEHCGYDSFRCEPDFHSLHFAPRPHVDNRHVIRAGIAYANILPVRRERHP